MQTTMTPPDSCCVVISAKRADAFWAPDVEGQFNLLTLRYYNTPFHLAPTITQRPRCTETQQNSHLNYV